MTKIFGDELKRLNGEERLGQNRESEYLGAEDIKTGAEPILTIEGIWNGLVTLQRGKENKDVLTFVEKHVEGINNNVRPLIVNATNRKALKKIYGNVQASTLQGKKIQLYIDHKVRDPQDGGFIDGVRIRLRIPVTGTKSIKCELCGTEITAFGKMSADELAAYRQKRYGKVLCNNCAKKQADENKAKNEEEESENNENITN